MFTKNPFNKKDEVADLIGNILESDYKVKKEELKGNQHKIDMNKNNKIDAHDFKLLRSKGTQEEEIDPNRTTTDTLKGRNVGKSPNKFLSQKVFMDVPGNVKEEVEDVAEGSIKDAETALAKHGQYKVDHEKKYGPMSGADLHQHEVIRKQLLDKKRRAQSAYAKKQGVAEGADDPYKGTTPTNGKVAARNGHRLGKTYNNPHSPKYHKDSYASWDRDYNNETARLKKKGVAEGSMIKSIKRGLQGWDKNAVGPSGEKLGNPKEIVKRAKAMDIDNAKKVRAGLDNAPEHSPAGLQKRVLDRKLKGVAEGLNEMDKSLPSSDRGGEGYGNPYAKGGKEGRATPITPEKMTSDTKKLLDKAMNKSHKKDVNNESVQIDELNKDTLYSYNKKAQADVEKKDKSLGQLIRKGDSVGANKTAHQLNNRLAGQERAEKRLNKEEVEGVAEGLVKSIKRGLQGWDKNAVGPSETDLDKEQIDERELTKGETKEKERIVKGMKKSLAGFKQRYGDRAKSVMYATATKAAKKD